MQRVWSRCFIPATCFAGAGVVLYVVSLLEPQDQEGGVVVAVGASVFLVVAFVLVARARPVLGVQD
jgi:hypothetical protein